ncbi:MAG: chromosome segregation SMC family protein [Candidatus Pacebacteria bacterium]|nr:chromosome segregation SMC family protein [Candidatus Paceibacterota bacterium]
MFVLSNKYSNLPLDEKRRIIHETEGAEAKKAVSVELVLNNKGRKLPIESDNVSIKRVFDSDSKRDEYYVNGKHIHKMDLKHILEATGLSFSNPFYFVQQGRISSIIALNEVQLFVFISEVAGTQVYDEKRTETLRALDEARQKRGKLTALLSKIDVHIDRLSKDAKLLKQYKRIENEKLALEYQVLELRTDRVAEKLTQMADEREERMRNFEHSKNQEQALKIEHDSLEKDKVTKERQVQLLKDSLEQLNLEKQEVENVMQKKESAQELSAQRAKEAEEELTNLESELEKLQSERAREQDSLKGVEDKLKDLDEQLAGSRDTIEQRRRRYEELTMKEGIGIKFRSVEERNKYVREEQKRNHAELERWKAERDSADAEVTQIRQKATETENAAEEAREKHEEMRKSQAEERRKIEELQNQRVGLVNKLKALDTEEHDLDLQKGQQKDQIRMWEEEQARAMGGNNLYHTIKMLLVEIGRAKIKGFHGLLIDLINIEKNFRPCADIIGKNALFGFVVDSIDTAEQILQINRQIHGSVITIYPLDMVDDMPVKDYKYPTVEEDKEKTCAPLIEHVTLGENVDPKVWRICRHTFGKALLVKDYKTAIKLAKEKNFHCVTIECEVVYAGGFVSRVGLYDLRRERVTLYSRIVEGRAEIRRIEGRDRELEAERAKLKDSDSGVLRSMQTCDSTVRYMGESLKNQELVLRNLENDLRGLRTAEAASRKNVEHCDSQIKILRAKKEDLAALLQEDNVNKLTEAEMQEMKALAKEVNDRESEVKKLLTLQAKQAEAITRIKQRLEKFINVRDQQLRDRINKVKQSFDVVDTVAAGGEDMGELASRLAKITLELEGKHKDLKTEADKHQGAHEKMYELEKALQKYKESVENDLERVEKLNAEFMELEEEKGNYLSQMEKIKKPIKKALESAAKERKDQAKEKGKKELEDELLDKISEKTSSLGQYKNIYKDAYDIYVKYTEKRKGFESRTEEFDQTEAAINELIDSLDKDKSKSFINTFKAIGSNFEKMFKEIIPSGVAQLKLLKCDEEAKETSSQHVFLVGDKKYKGIAIQVSFDGDQNYQNLQQLSGGQKVAVAISLIFAIQHLDPPPVYILDEIDSALDTNYRINLANLIAKQSEHSQFLVTTFKPELLEVAKKFYEVEYRNKTSKFKETTFDRAKVLVSLSDQPVANP